MSNVRVSAKLIPAPGGKSDIQVDLMPEGASLFTVLVLDSKSARNVAAMLVKLADAAELTILTPSHAIVPPTNT